MLGFSWNINFALLESARYFWKCTVVSHPWYCLYLVESVMSLSCWIDAEKWLRIAKKRTGKDHTIIINSYGLLENPNIYLISYAKLTTDYEKTITNMQNITKYSTKRNYKYVPFQEAFPWIQWTCLVPHLHRAPTSLSISFLHLLASAWKSRKASNTDFAWRLLVGYAENKTLVKTFKRSSLHTIF